MSRFATSANDSAFTGSVIDASFSSGCVLVAGFFCLGRVSTLGCCTVVDCEETSFDCAACDDIDDEGSTVVGFTGPGRSSTFAFGFDTGGIGGTGGVLEAFVGFTSGGIPVENVRYESEKRGFWGFSCRSPCRETDKRTIF